MFALHKAFEQSTKSVQDVARAERERRGQLSDQSGGSHLAFPSPMLSTAPRCRRSEIGTHLAASPLVRSVSYQDQNSRSSSHQTPLSTSSSLRSLNSLSPPGPAPTSQLPPVPAAGVHSARLSSGSPQRPLSPSSLRAKSIRTPGRSRLLSGLTPQGEHESEHLIPEENIQSDSSAFLFPPPDGAEISSPRTSDDNQMQRVRNKHREAQASDRVIDEIESSHLFSLPEERPERLDSSFSRRHQDLAPPRVLLPPPPQGDASTRERPDSLLSKGDGSHRQEVKPLRSSSAKSESPAEPRASFSSSSRFKLFGKKNREKYTPPEEISSSFESGARDSSLEILGPHAEDIADGRESRLSEESRGRTYTSSEQPSLQRGPVVTQAARSGSCPSLDEKEIHANSRQPTSLHGDGARGPSMATAATSRKVLHSSTDSTSSSPGLSFAYMGLVIHTGYSNHSTSTDSARVSQSAMPGHATSGDHSPATLFERSIRAATDLSTREESQDVASETIQRPATACSRMMSSSDESDKGIEPASQSRLNPATSPGVPTPSHQTLLPHSSGYSDKDSDQREFEIASTAGRIPPTEGHQRSIRISASKTLQSIRSRSSSNLRLFGRSITKESVPTQVDERTDSNTVDGSSRKSEGASGVGSRLAVPPMIQAWAAVPPLAGPKPRQPSSSPIPQASTIMARAFSKRRPATGHDTSNDGAGSHASLSPPMSRASIAADDGAGNDGRLCSDSFTSSSVSTGGWRPTTPAGQSSGNSKLAASGGAAALFSSSSDVKLKTVGRAGKGLFGSSINGGGPNWLTPRKKNASSTEFDLMTIPAAPSMEGRISDITTTNASRSRTRGLNEVTEQSPAPPTEAVQKKSKAVAYSPLTNESPQAFCERLESIVSHGDIVTVLATSGDPFYVEALRCHMRRFLFVGNSLDIALRKLLMEVCLPKETQQIDRVMEAFAQRYDECNEGLFASEDQPYILAFSLMMLHTDAFNKNAKNKMTKAEYVRNSSSSGVAQDVLEYLYDNLTFTQFVYFDELENDMSQSPKTAKSASAAPASSGFLSRGSNGGPSSGAKDKYGKIDVYLLIKQGRLSEFQPWIEHLIPEDDPYSWSGTEDDLDVASLAEAYLAAPSIEISTHRRPSLLSSSQGPSGQLDVARITDDDPSVTLRVFKVGIVNRKDDVTEKGKRTSRKWRSCGVILSSSQLLFFRDLVWIDALKAQIDEQIRAACPEDRRMGILISPKIRDLKPDDVMSLGDALAVQDATYDKHENVFRLLNQEGGVQLEYLFQDKNEVEMNDWIAAINFCACFRAAGLKVTDLDVSAFEAEKSGEEDRYDLLKPPRSSTVSPGMRRSFSKEITPKTGPTMASDCLQIRLAARVQELLSPLQEFTKTLKNTAAELSELLRLAKHFAIMTPFQRATKDRIEAAAVPLAARIRQLRIAVAKNESRTFILASELRAAESQLKKVCTYNNGGALNNWSFLQRNRSSGSDGVASSPSSPLSPRGANAFTSTPMHSGLPGGRWPQERKSSLRSQAGSDPDGSTSNSISLHPLTEGIAVEGNSPRPLLLISGAERSEEVVSPSKSIGTFAPISSDHEYAASIISNSSRSGTGRRKSSSTGFPRRRTSGDRNGDIAESWEATKAFRDPDRISIAQLPDLSTLEAVTRKKTLQRAALENSVSQSDEWDSIIKGPSGRKQRKTSANSSLETGKMKRAASLSSGSGSQVLQQPAIDPPAFMMTWGM